MTLEQEIVFEEDSTCEHCENPENCHECEDCDDCDDCSNCDEYDDDKNVFSMVLYAHIDEESCYEIVDRLLELDSMIDEKFQPTIKFNISTYGGCVYELFTLVDILNNLKRKGAIVETSGWGKVMSSGVPLISVGTKGSRTCGKNCRFMLHPISHTINGEVNVKEMDFQKERKEGKIVEQQFRQILLENTNMSLKEINKILKGKDKNYYFSAQQALEWGIVDEIL